ncbi:MAG: carbon-nitrogen hydrolase family protein [Terriglobia bacterium]
MATKLTVAVAQATPVVLDLAGAVEKACAWMAEAGRYGARLVAFPETWIPCYPLWCDAGTFGKWDHGPSKRLQARLARNSLAIPSAETKKLCAAARAAQVAVVMGANERDTSSGSLYNTLLFISAQGELRGRHRKLVPTFGERLVWGYGDAAGLQAYEFDGARVGGLICWEHWMPLARHVLHSSAEQVHVAAWPHGKERHQLASRHYAFEGRAFVLAAASFLKKSDLPADFELAEDFKDAPEVLLEGGSAIIGPDGEYVVEPVFGGEELLTAEIDLERVSEEKLLLDVGGHYARPDLFDVRVRREPLRPFRPVAEEEQD